MVKISPSVSELQYSIELWLEKIRIMITSEGDFWHFVILIWIFDQKCNLWVHTDTWPPNSSPFILEAKFEEMFVHMNVMVNLKTLHICDNKGFIFYWYNVELHLLLVAMWRLGLTLHSLIAFKNSSTIEQRPHPVCWFVIFEEHSVHTVRVKNETVYNSCIEKWIWASVTEINTVNLWRISLTSQAHWQV